MGQSFCSIRWRLVPLSKPLGFGFNGCEPAAFLIDVCPLFFGKRHYAGWCIEWTELIAWIKKKKFPNCLCCKLGFIGLLKGDGADFKCHLHIIAAIEVAANIYVAQKIDCFLILALIKIMCAFYQSFLSGAASHRQFCNYQDAHHQKEKFPSPSGRWVNGEGPA